MKTDKSNEITEIFVRLGGEKLINLPTIVRNEDGVERRAEVLKIFVEALLTDDKRLTKKDRDVICEQTIKALSEHFDDDLQTLAQTQPKKLADVGMGWIREEQCLTLFRSMYQAGELPQFARLVFNTKSHLPTHIKQAYEDWIETPEFKLTDNEVRHMLMHATGFPNPSDEKEDYDEFMKMRGNIYSIDWMFTSLLDRIDDDLARAIIYADVVTSQKKWFFFDASEQMIADQKIDRTRFRDEAFRKKFSGIVRDHVAKAWPKTRAQTRKYFKENPDDLVRLFEICEEQDLLLYIDAVVKSEDNALPKGADKAFQQWADDKGIDLSNLPAPAGITPPKHVFKVQEQVIEQKSGYSIADKQAFFDGVDVVDAADVLMRTDQITYEDGYEAGREISKIISDVGKKIKIKTGLEKILEHPSSDMRHTQLLGLLVKITDRATKKDKSKKGILPVSNPEEFNKKIWHFALSHEGTREKWFQAAKDHDFLPELYFFLNAYDSYAPDGTIDHLMDWCEANDIRLDQILEDYELPEMDNLDAVIQAGFEARQQAKTPDTPTIETVDDIEEAEIEDTPIANDNEPEAPISPIQKVIVPDLLPEGEGSESVPDLVEIFREESGEKKERDVITEPRDEWVMDVLVNDPFIDHAACRHYVNPLETTDHSGRYYSVFHVVTLDGNTTQIAVSTCKGQITYLMKMEHGLMVNPNTQQCVRDLSDLRKERMVQTKRCHSKEGFQRDIAEIIYKSHDALKPQSKGTVRWQGVMSRAEQLKNSVMDCYLRTNKAPKRNSGIIAHGDSGENEMGIKRSLVELDTRWDLVDSAIKQNLIVGLEDFGSLYEYTTYVITGEKPTLPTPQAKKLIA
jgi:hypothetical protein